jgi:hypothetical protein
MPYRFWGLLDSCLAAYEAKSSAAMCRVSVIPQQLFCGGFWPIEAIRCQYLCNITNIKSEHLKLSTMFISMRNLIA